MQWKQPAGHRREAEEPSSSMALVNKGNYAARSKGGLTHARGTQRGGMSLCYNTRLFSKYGPVENDPAELGLNAAQQLQLEEVLTQAIGAPVAGTHAAETGVAAEKHKTFVYSPQRHHTRTLAHKYTPGHDRFRENENNITTYNHWSK